MKRIILFSAVAAMLAALFLCGCGKKAPQTGTIALPSNATTGYEWFAFQNDELFEISKEYSENEHEEGMVGVGGTTTFTLVPVKPGKCEVSFVYQRPWEAMELGDSYTFYFTVTKDMQISVTGMAGDVKGSSDELPFIPDIIISN